MLPFHEPANQRRQGSVNIRQDTILGSFFIIIGVTAFLMALQYPFGTTSRMGPGYFPVLISVLLSFTGLAILVRGRIRETALLEAGRLKPLAIVLVAVVIFGFFIDKLGMPLSIFALLLVAATASVKFALSWKATVGAAAFSALCGLIFVRLLGLPIPMIGTWLQAFGL